MERHVHEDLRALNGKLAAMGALVEGRVGSAMRALVERREDLAAAVATSDHEVNALDEDIDDLTLKLLALQHPVASDLRLVRSAIKVNIDLERIGDQAVNIAEASLRLVPHPPLPATRDVSALAEVALQMLHDAMTAFLNHDTALARAVLLRDDDADRLRDQIFRDLVAEMSTDREAAEQALSLVLVSRALERVADHATNIAEDLIFLVEGRVVRRAEVHDA